MGRTNLVRQVEKRAEKEIHEEPETYTTNDLIPTGSTLLNLALSDNPYGGWRKGRMVNVIGDSSAGKSFMALTTFAEANTLKRLDDYQFIYDDAEHANSFNMNKLFGASTAKRIKAPAYTEENEPINSTLVEDFHDYIDRLLKKKEHFIYILDSFDSISTEAEEDKTEEMLEARRKGKETKGSYGMTKAKKASDILRNICGKLEKTEAVLNIISQTRDNIDPMSFSKKTRSGGKALKFYATHELWLAGAGAIKKKDRVIGTKCAIKVSKNKLTGKVREVEFPIYYDYGIDNLGSCIDFMIKEKFWKGGGNSKIEFGGTWDISACTKEKLISLIEENSWERKLAKVVGEAWYEIEESLKLGRKSKYK